MDGSSKPPGRRDWNLLTRGHANKKNQHIGALTDALRGSTVSYARDAHFPKHSFEYSLIFLESVKKKEKEKSAYRSRYRRTSGKPITWRSSGGRGGGVQGLKRVPGCKMAILSDSNYLILGTQGHVHS